jgi:hypothetical protein
MGCVPEAPDRSIVVPVRWLRQRFAKTRRTSISTDAGDGIRRSLIDLGGFCHFFFENAFSSGLSRDAIFLQPSCRRRLAWRYQSASGAA